LKFSNNYHGEDISYLIIPTRKETVDWVTLKGTKSRMQEKFNHDSKKVDGKFKQQRRKEIRQD
jgi:hypothetical protein